MAQQLKSAAILRQRVIEYLPTSPQTAVPAIDLFDIPPIQEVCNNKGKLSILLADMVKNGKGAIKRIPITDPTSGSRFAYYRDLEAVIEPKVRKNSKAKSKHSPVIVTTPQTRHVPVNSDKIHVYIKDEVIIVEAPKVKVTIDLL